MIQVLSDIHSEMMTIDDAKVFCDKILTPSLTEKQVDVVLAGDIGNPYMDSYKYILEHCSSIYRRVFICTGNHEYYHSMSVDYIDYQITKLCNLYDNVYFLNKQTYEFDDIVILGCTLWTFIPNEFKHVVTESMNDYNYIPDFNVYEQNKLHEKHVNWLKSEIEQIKTNKKLIVVTHHLPTFKLIDDMYKNSNLNHAFANTDCDDLFKSVDYWVCGHTHIYANIVIDDCTLIVNPIGYPDEKTMYKHIEIQL